MVSANRRQSGGRSFCFYIGRLSGHHSSEQVQARCGALGVPVGSRTIYQRTLKWRKGCLWVGVSTLETISAPKTEYQHEPWFRLATRCAAEIRKRFGVPDTVTEERIVRVFRSALRPRKKAGRKLDKETARAAELWIAGMKRFSLPTQPLSLRQFQHRLWQDIYRTVYPDFERWDALKKQYFTGTLRRNLKAYLRRQGLKLSLAIRVSTPIHQRNRVLSKPSRPDRK